jgi:SAM-dependent methyltransferase
LKLLLAGAAEALLVTPVVSEARFARQMAERLGFRARFHPVVGIGEELPLASESCDVAISGGSLHHMVTAEAGREIRRVLDVGGRFGAWDPWRAPLYRAGITIFGKREPGVGCRPIDDERAAAFTQSFGPGADYRRHGAVVRYPLLALNKAGMSLGIRRTLPIFRRDDRLAGSLPALQRLQSSVSMCAERTTR